MFSCPEFRKLHKNNFKGKFKLLSASKVCQLASKTAPFTFTLVRYTKPFLSADFYHYPGATRREFSVLTRTTARFLQIVVHFCLLWSRDKYSLDHHFQKIPARYCTCLHLCQEESSFWNNPGGIWGSEHKRSRWFGIRGSGPLESPKTVVIGRPLIILSTSHRRVTKSSWSSVWVWSKVQETLHVVQIQRSQTPP